MKKNIIIFHTDELRYDSLGCTGNTNAKTTNIDQLASEGFNFTRHMSCNTVCMPSRASLFTGMYLPGHGLILNGTPLWRAPDAEYNPDADPQVVKDLAFYNGNIRRKIPTMADVFKENGYSTALFGKLHLTPHLAASNDNFYESKMYWTREDAEEYDGDYYGFETHLLALSHGESPCDYEGGHYGRWLHRNYPEVVKEMYDHQKNRKEQHARGDIYASKIPSELHHSTWLANESCKYIDEHKDSDKPMFMFVGFPDPHQPFTPPEDIIGDFMDIKLPEFKSLDKVVGEPTSAVKHAIEHNIATEDDIEYAYKYTQAMTYLVDKSIGKVIQKLKDENMYDDTIIMFTADHGDMLGNFQGVCKNGVPFDDLLHIPCIIKPYKGFESDVDTTVAMSNADVFPTLLNMVGLGDAKNTECIQGMDIFGGKAEENRPISTGGGSNGKIYTIFDKRYKYSYYLGTYEEELYDCIEDPNEYNNLAKDEKYREMCDKLKLDVLHKHLESEKNMMNHYGTW